MKKTLTLLLTLAMLLSLAACSVNVGNKYEADVPETSPEPSGTQPQEPSAPVIPEDTDEPGQDAGPAVPSPEEPDSTDQESGDDDPSAAPTIHVSHTDVTLFSAGETFRFTVWDSDGNDPSTCTYTSADPAIASVDESGGEVTAAAPGTTTITAHVEFNGEKQDFDCIVRCKWEDGESTEGAEDVGPSQPASGTAAAPSLSDFFTTLQGKYEGLGGMMLMEGELLDNYYPGLSDIAAVEEVYIQETMMSIANVAVGLVKLSSDATLDDLTAVQGILQARIDTQANGGAWYPESCETWKKGVITSVSNVVGMFVYPDEVQAMADLFTETFSN